jgi:hypothetical protein
LPKSTARNALNPLPSLIRASAWDAVTWRKHKRGRKFSAPWTKADANHAAETQERLVRACYGRPWDREGSPLPFIRFQIAEQYEKAGEFTLTSDFAAISDAIDASLVQSVGIPLTH